MARALQVKLSGIDTKEKSKRLLYEFKRYLNDYAELEKEYIRIPKWRHFKIMKNLKKRENLTRDYKVKMFELGVFN